MGEGRSEDRKVDVMGDQYRITDYVATFPKDVQDSIRKALTTSLKHWGYTGKELRDAVKDGMDSRLSDLEGLDTRRYLDMANGKLLKAPSKNAPRYKLTYNNYYSRNQTGDLITEIQPDTDETAYRKARQILSEIIREHPGRLPEMPMVSVHKYNTTTKRFRKVYVAFYDYDNKKVVGRSVSILKTTKTAKRRL